MALLELAPACKDYIWGGNRLKEEYGVHTDMDPCAEAWVLSAYPDSSSVIADGPDKGKSFYNYLQLHGKEVLGSKCSRFKDFPILTKFIDAKRSLSIQVHPDEEYASKVENAHGKTEMWYILDAEPGAFLYFGFEKSISREEFQQRIENNTLEEVLHKEYVHKGDVFFIEAGTLHAIGAGILIAEIQQNSNITYRIYDYGRLGKDGKPRELHIAKALDVTKREPAVRKTFSDGHIGKCEYFTVDTFTVGSAQSSDSEPGRTSSDGQLKLNVGSESFLHILITEGSGEITACGESKPVTKGMSLFLTAGSGVVVLKGSLKGLLTYE